MEIIASLLVGFLLGIGLALWIVDNAEKRFINGEIFTANGKSYRYTEVKEAPHV